MKTLIILFVIIAFISKVNGQEFNEYYENGQLKVQGINDSLGNKIGVWKIFHENGQLKDIQEYIKGKRTGEWKSFYKNGQLQTIGKYEKGVKIGEWKTYYDNGNIFYITEHGFKGRASGISKVYFKNGNLNVDGNYKNGSRAGKWSFYRKNGNLLKVISYKSGKKNGECKYFNEVGDLKETVNYINGKKVEQYAPVQASTQNDTVFLNFISSNWTSNSLLLRYRIVNNTDKLVTILNARPILNQSYLSTNVSPEFFNLLISPKEALCEYEEYEEDKLIKLKKDFLEIPSKDSIEIRINADDYAQGICNSKINKVEILLTYKLDERFQDKDFFEKYIKDVNISDFNKENLFKLYRALYNGTVISKKILIER